MRVIAKYRNQKDLYRVAVLEAIEVRVYLDKGEVEVITEKHSWKFLVSKITPINANTEVITLEGTFISCE